MSIPAPLDQRGRRGQTENLSQEASHHPPQGSLVAREDVPKHKAQAQASRSFPAGPSHTKAATQVSEDVLAACSESSSMLFPPPVFNHDGSLALLPNPDLLHPTPELTSGNASRQAPEHCDGCTGTPANQGDDRPRPPPPAGQPPSQKEHVPKPAIEYDVDTNRRIAALDKDTRTLVKSYGGYPLNNQLRVLKKAEAWQTENGRSLMDVERKDGKGGVLSVTCNVCLAQKHDMLLEDAQHKTVQKAAEHIISFHWELSAWSCIVDGCGKVFRRKQECDRHEESHGIVTKKKGKKIANQQATGNTVLPPPSNPPQNPVPTTASHKSKTKRHEPVPPTAAFLALPSASGGPVRPRSRDPSPHRHAPYTIRPTRSAPDLPALQNQPSTSSVPNISSRHNGIPAYSPSPSMTTKAPAPRFLLTDDTGAYSQLPYNTTGTGIFSPPPQLGDIHNFQRYPTHDALAQAYPQFLPPQPPQGQRIAQAQDMSLQNGTLPTQAEFVPTTTYGPPRMDPFSMQPGQLHQQYSYAQPPMNATRTMPRTTTTTHQSGQNPFQPDSPPYRPDGFGGWKYQPYD